MRVIVIGTKPGEITCKNIVGELEEYQECVGGYIQPAAPVQLRQMGIEMLVNEEGLLAHLDPNPNLFPFFFVGTAVLVGIDPKGEEFIGLTDDQMTYAMGFLRGLKGYWNE